MIGRQWINLGVLAVLGCCATASHAADIVQGKALARSLCSNCHIVAPGEAPAEVTAGIPDFKAIADKDGQTADKILAAILSPHPPMPQVQLSTFERGNLAAYILSLKGTN